MGRYYRLSKKVTEEQAAEILRELKERDDIKRAIITEERDTMIVETIDGESISAAGSRAVSCHLCILILRDLLPDGVKILFINNEIVVFK